MNSVILLTTGKWQQRTLGSCFLKARIGSKIAELKQTNNTIQSQNCEEHDILD